jgi:RNA polymerase sigma factor (sigma-70 family)
MSCAGMSTAEPVPGEDDVDFDAFFVRVEPRLRAALTALYGPDMGREATAEAMAWAFEHWRRIRRIEHPVAYLYRVGQSRTRRIRRATPITFTTDGMIATTEFDPRLPRALEELPEKQRIAVVLVHGYDWSHGDVASLLGVDKSTVATHISRALERLRILLKVDAHD